MPPGIQLVNWEMQMIILYHNTELKLLNYAPLCIPSIWNSENIEKFNPNQLAYLKSLKKRLLSNL
jgi:hypothetical protein